MTVRCWILPLVSRVSSSRCRLYSCPENCRASMALSPGARRPGGTVLSPPTTQCFLHQHQDTRTLATQTSHSFTAILWLTRLSPSPIGSYPKLYRTCGIQVVLCSLLIPKATSSYIIVNVTWLTYKLEILLKSFIQQIVTEHQRCVRHLATSPWVYHLIINMYFSKYMKALKILRDKHRGSVGIWKKNLIFLAVRWKTFLGNNHHLWVWGVSWLWNPEVPEWHDALRQISKGLDQRKNSPSLHPVLLSNAFPLLFIPDHHQISCFPPNTHTSYPAFRGCLRQPLSPNAARQGNSNSTCPKQEAHHTLSPKNTTSAMFILHHDMALTSPYILLGI